MLRFFDLRYFGALANATPVLPPSLGCGLDCSPSGAACPVAFDRLVVTYTGRQGAQVYWSLLAEFTDPTPHEFQLQRAEDPAPDADWEDVGPLLRNAVTATDAGVKPFHRANPPHYRVRLHTPNGAYYSPATARWGTLSKRGWRQVQEALAQEIWNHKNSPGSSLGWLLKSRTVGSDCHRCFNRETRQARDPNCPVCYGTGKTCGYYAPLGCVWANLPPKADVLDRDATRGSIYSSTRQARMVTLPLVDVDDVWVHGKNGDRYYVHSTKALVEVEDVTVVSEVELRLAAASDIVYAIATPALME